METIKKPIFENMTFQEIISTSVYVLNPINNDELPYKFSIFVNTKADKYFFSGYIYDDDKGMLDGILDGCNFNDEATFQVAFLKIKSCLIGKYLKMCLKDETAFFNKYYSKGAVEAIINTLIEYGAK